MECAICIESFNKSTRKRVICSYCPTDGTETPVCMNCTKTYLLQDDAHTPRCAACRAGWTEDFMTQTFAKTWLLKEYKAHRERILLDTERARLPEAQEDAGRYRRALVVIEAVDKETEPFFTQIKNLPEHQVEKDTYTAYYEASRIRGEYDRATQERLARLRDIEHDAFVTLDVLGCDPLPDDPVWCAEMEALPPTDERCEYYKRLMEAHRERVPLDQQYTERRATLRAEESRLWRLFIDARNQLVIAKAPFLQQIATLHTREYKAALSVRKSVGKAPVQRAQGAPVVERSRWTFVMKCPLAGCEGFVGTDWKCGLCEAKFCKECGDRETVEESPAASPEATAVATATPTTHLCDPDVRATHQALRKEAKPCPKCAALISKIDGCDQMWCTQCQTAFSWRTGQIETSHIHNPHYFQWMRQQGTEAPARPIGDCLNLEPEELLEQVIHYALRRRNHIVSEWARSIRHYHWVQRDHQYKLRQKQDEDWRRQLRVKRLVNEITDDIWKDRLQRGEKATQKEFAVVQVLELFQQAGLDVLRNTLPEDADLEPLLEQLEALRKFCNSEMLKIQKRFNNDVVYFERVKLRTR
jgi:hypothetical protein